MTEDKQDKLLDQALNGEISWEEYSRRVDHDLMHGPGAGRPLGLFQLDPVTAKGLKLLADELEQQQNGKVQLKRMGIYLLKRAQGGA